LILRMNLYTVHTIGDLQVDFIKIVARICKIDVKVYPVDTGSELETKLLDMTSGIKGTFPMLEFEPGALMCDSLAIVALLVRTSAKVNKDESLLGSTLKEQNDQIEWITFMRETCMPKIETLKMMVFGQHYTTKQEFDILYDEFMKNMEVFQIHLKTKRMFMVGASLTISDIYFVLMTKDMYQCIMDPNSRGRIPNVNKLFKYVT